MADAQGRSQVVALLDRHDVRPRKSLGQHFVVDPSVVDKLIRLAEVAPGDRVLEVGAGTGTLTVALAARGAIVRAYEVDERLRPVLVEVLAHHDDVELRFADAAREDFGSTLDGGSWTMISNLPYNVGTPLVLDLLRRAPQVARFAVMVQREVADRFAAAPGSKSYGLPSVVVALHARVIGPVTRLPPAVFYPPPRVDSALIVLHRRADVARAAGGAVRLAAAAFGQRRKMVRNSMAAFATEAQLRAAGIDPACRAEELSPSDYIRLADEVADG